MSFFCYLCFSAHGGVQSEEHGGCPIIGNNWLLVGSTWVHPLFLVGSVLPIFLVLCVVLCFACLRPVSCDSILPVSLDCPFSIAPSIFSNVYLIIFHKYFEISLKININIIL